MLMTASCMFPLHQGTLLQPWMVYSHVWPLSSHGYRRMNWNWTQIKLNSSLLGMNDSGENTSLYFPLSFSVSKLNLLNLLRLLEVIFDKNFTFHSHISAVCSSCFYHMWNLQRICRHLDQDSAKLLATALMSSRLDYCNSSLYGIEIDIDLTRLHRVQNQMARLVTKSPPFTCSLPLFCSLHWLPVRFRILFKINLLTYKTWRENSLFIFTPCLPHPFHPIHWDQTTITVCQSLG